MSGDLKFLGVRVPVETAERLRALAAMRSRSLNAEARVALEAHLAQSARELQNDGGPVATDQPGLHDRAMQEPEPLDRARY